MALARVLVVLGVLFAVASVIAGYVRYQALDTPTVEKTANDLIADDEIRNQVAATLVDQLFSNVDVQAEPRAASATGSAGALPPPCRRDCASSQTGRLNGCSPDRGSRPSGSPRSFELTSSSCDSSTTSSPMSARKTGPWCSISNRSSSSSGIRSQSSAPFAERLPADTGRVEVLQSDQLETAQNLTQLLNNLARFLWLVPLALFAIALWLARGRRRTTLRMVAIGLIVAGLLVLLARRLAGDYVVDHRRQERRSTAGCQRRVGHPDRRSLRMAAGRSSCSE